MKTSSFLFLQGQIGRFFSELGVGLHRRGHAVRRIHFNGGDACFWDLPAAVDFTGTATQWPDFFNGCLADWGITDLILFGDCRPLHAVAIGLARLRDVRVHVFEEGYLRPDYITLESGGVNGYSALPRDAESYFQAAATLPAWAPAAPVAASFVRRACDDVRYNLNSVVAAWRYPHYQSHRLWHPFIEYAVGAGRLPLKALTRRQTAHRVNQVLQGVRPYFVFPMQLDADSQIRFHAEPGGMAAAIHQVMRSFATAAPADTLLVVTEHPLDYSPRNLARLIKERAMQDGVADRVVFLRGGSPTALVNKARGLVTVNSTIGISALAAAVPVMTLGKAIYSLPGLTHQKGIDSFWAGAQPPETQLFEAFRRVVAERTQINGGFYSAEGIARAVAGALQRLEKSRAGAEAKLVDRSPEAIAPSPTHHVAWRGLPAGSKARATSA